MGFIYFLIHKKLCYRSRLSCNNFVTGVDCLTTDLNRGLSIELNAKIIFGAALMSFRLNIFEHVNLNCKIRKLMFFISKI